MITPKKNINDYTKKFAATQVAAAGLRRARDAARCSRPGEGGTVDPYWGRDCPTDGCGGPRSRRGRMRKKDTYCLPPQARTRKGGTGRARRWQQLCARKRRAAKKIRAVLL